MRTGLVVAPENRASVVKEVAGTPEHTLAVSGASLRLVEGVAGAGWQLYELLPEGDEVPRESQRWVRFGALNANHARNVAGLLVDGLRAHAVRN